MRKGILPILLGLVLFLLGFSALEASELPPAQKADKEAEVKELKALLKELQERLERLEGEKKSGSEETTSQSEIEKIKKTQSRNNQRLMTVEREVGLDRIRFSGDFRFEAHSIDASVPAHFDGMKLQNLMVNTMFHYGATGMFPQNMNEVDNTIRGNYADYLYFTNNLTFDQLKNTVGMFSPQQQQQLFGMLMPHTAVPSYEADNGILYTNRLRLQMDAKVAENVSFQGRLSMYKVFGDSTGIQVFNGQSNSLAIDGNTAGVPNSDILRVERAYFTWNNIGGSNAYLSIGRRPSTGGAPLNFRQDEPRGGTPAASLIDYQFDGITMGYHLGEHSTFRLCYGLGYESGFGNGELTKLPQDRLDDVHFFGFNWDLWSTDKTFLQATVAKAFNVTDGFNGLVVMPNNPVTGAAIGAPLAMRYSPSANMGDLNMAALVLTRREGPMDLFVSGNMISTDPEPITTPFGGLMSDPFEMPEGRTGGMVYVGSRWNSPSENTKLGFEYNWGSKYWFNMAMAEDDIVAPKTMTRGGVYETYLTHRISRRFILKVDYQHYDYDWSGSGWHLGAPKALDSMPLLGFPTYDNVNKLAVGITARF